MGLLAVVDAAKDGVTQVDTNLQPLSIILDTSSACACEPTSANFRVGPSWFVGCTALKPAVKGSVVAVEDMVAILYGDRIALGVVRIGSVLVLHK